MKDSRGTAADVTSERIARRVQALRRQRGLSLAALAQRCKVSRSMISLIERAESSPTAVVLDRLAVGLGVTLASLFEDRGGSAAAGPLVRRAAQPAWRDPDSGYLRRNLSPAHAGAPLQLVQVELPPGASVSYDSTLREHPVHQQVWVLQGALEMRVGDDEHHLDRGDCLALTLDRPTAFANAGQKPVRYLVAIVSR
jgi:transcriptional regulator with XRE-family HTH domain